MLNYWDLAEADRAKLSADDVERFVSAELMTKGVLRVKPLELVDAPEMPEPDTAVFVLQVGYHAAELAFPNATAAAAALGHATALVGTTYVRGYDTVPTLAKLDDQGAVKEKRVYSEQQIALCRQQIEKALAAKAENDRRKKEYAEAQKAETEALKGLWDDWHECRGKAAKMRRVAATYAEYQSLAGDADVAAKFLRRAFPLETILEAATWCGFEISKAALDQEPEPAPKQPAANGVDDASIPF